jgi:hypothetical protein
LLLAVPKTTNEKKLYYGWMMKAKKYVPGKGASKRTEHLIKENGGRYARQIPYRAPRSVGISLAQAKKRLSKPVKRTAKEIRWALGIVGIGKGPKDLSENMRAYLRREK